MAYKLEKPCSLKDRINFLSKYNDEMGLSVYERETAIYALENNEVMVGEIPTLNPYFEVEELEKAKNDKIRENDIKRDAELEKGVVYQKVLFDSDTDQKINIMAMYNSLPDGACVTWFGKENDKLEVDKDDLMLIGLEITNLHQYCWTKNAEIKAQIKKATTVEEVKKIVIEYNYEK